MSTATPHVRRNRDVLRRDRLDAMAATLGVLPPAGDAIPPLWHWMMFQIWKPPSELGADGHPSSDSFLPLSQQFPRRMAAGFTFEFHADLPVEAPIERASTVIADERKNGRSGPLRFVTVEHVYSARGQACVRELQHLVYRPAQDERTDDDARAAADSREVTSAPGRTARQGPGRDTVAPPDDPSPPLAVVRTVAVDSVMLFRYSALTGIGHRIHYDADYTRDVEGYPGLVIHGPLQAILLVGLATSGAFGARALAKLEVRSVRPAFTTTAPLTVEGSAVAGGVRLQTRDVAGTVCTTAAGTWR